MLMRVLVNERQTEQIEAIAEISGSPDALSSLQRRRASLVFPFVSCSCEKFLRAGFGQLDLQRGSEEHRPKTVPSLKAAQPNTRAEPMTVKARPDRNSQSPLGMLSFWEH